MLTQPTDVVMKQIAKDREAQRLQAQQEYKNAQQTKTPSEPAPARTEQRLITTIKLWFKPSLG